jgi:hypothetical protein
VNSNGTSVSRQFLRLILLCDKRLCYDRTDAKASALSYDRTDAKASALSYDETGTKAVL